MSHSAPVGSPCVNICQMDAVTGWCQGCLRTLDEIASWSQLSDDGKRAVWQLLARRRVQWRAHQQTQRQQDQAPKD